MKLYRISRAVKHDAAVDRWLAAEPVELRSIAHTWFARMRECGSDLQEAMHDGCPVACVEDVPFAYVNAFTSHVNVGFYYGAALDDRDRLLIGDGKRMRHVKLTPGVETNAEALGRLITAAYVDLKARLAADKAE